MTSSENFVNPAPAGGRQNSGLRALSVSLLVLRAGPFLILNLIVLCVALSLIVPVVLTWRNVGNVLAQTAVIAIVAIGQQIVILTRGIDLSVGSNLALASVLGALVYKRVDSSIAVAAVMAEVGALNGLGDA